MSYPGSAASENPNDTITKLQKRADRASSDAHKARAILFDILYPEYETKEAEFKQAFVHYKEEMKNAIAQRDELKNRLGKADAEIKRLRLLISEISKKEAAS